MQDWIINRLFPNRETGIFGFPFWALHAPSASFGPFVLRAGLIAGVALANLGRGAIQTREPLDELLRLICHVYAGTENYSACAGGGGGKETPLLPSQSSARATRVNPAPLPLP